MKGRDGEFGSEGQDSKKKEEVSEPKIPVDAQNLVRVIRKREQRHRCAAKN